MPKAHRMQGPLHSPSYSSFRAATVLSRASHNTGKRVLKSNAIFGLQVIQNHFCLQFISQNQSHCLSVKVPSQLVKGWQTLMRSVNGISMTALSQTQILRSPSLPHASCIPSAPREPVLALMLFTKDCQFSTNQTSLGALS